MDIQPIDDFHCHLRQSSMMEMVAPKISSGGVRLALVMPNLRPPITTTDQALAYKTELSLLSPTTEFLMTLYLNPELTPEEIYHAHANGIIGVKSYPKGVTTNSDSGIESYELYYPVFEAMQKVGMVLNLHGEIPSDSAKDVCVMNAEQEFLTHLIKLHQDFPSLKIVLEHATTMKAVECVKSLGNTVACTITIHHLILVVDDWAGCCHNFCKPVAKFPHDRAALRESGHPRFFLGTDSAPHPRAAKEGKIAAAGVFVTPYTALYLVTALDSFGALSQLDNFASRYGRIFYGLPEGKGTLRLEKKEFVIPSEIDYIENDGCKSSVVPFMADSPVVQAVEGEYR